MTTTRDRFRGGIGGDADTIAAMAGALAGARYGATAIPEVWTGVEGEERLVELAGAMHKRVG
jgi:poly(ADP-ribose) glycohydrolase ARH3